MHPKFAVVGHPNKGKSSIVSALAMDDSVQISDTPGTTTQHRSFPLRVDGKVLYELFDTPGFQRARRVLAWLQQHEVSADKRDEIVKQFIYEHKDNQDFNDEIALLEPIVQGAGIIYIVDASKPYGKEYEAEMEVLRWTGQPSMALLNHIDDADYSDEWKRALNQYFKMVRTFNPMKATFTQHMGILESMAQLKEEWVAPVKASMRVLEGYHQQMLNNTSKLIARLVHESTTLIEKLPFGGDDASDAEKATLEAQYKDKLRALEAQTQAKIEAIWHHKHLETQRENFSFENVDLFSQESESVFGLSKKELMVTGMTSGAVTGAGIDLLFAGHTLLLGGAIGAVVGATGAYFGFDELAEVKVLGRTLGQKYLEIGPMANRNFPYILLGRTLFYSLQVIQNSHASREVLSINMDSTFKEQWLDEHTRKELEKYHKVFRSKKDMESMDFSAYEALVFHRLKDLVEDSV